jgi:hypothetical protein
MAAIGASPRAQGIADCIPSQRLFEWREMLDAGGDVVSLPTALSSPCVGIC